MGALHEGHLELVRRAVAENDRALVSVFVNPLQFDDPSDLEAYPRDFAGDAARLAEVSCAMVFTGTLAGFFPGARGPEDVAPVDPGPGALGLEGDARRGHFAGVAAIVARLFELVRPTRAYFGAKDFQQTLVVRHVARQMDGPRIVVCPTSRDPDGLARSSRNTRLSAEERRRALALSGALRATGRAWESGERDAQRLTRVLQGELESAGLRPDYAEVRDPGAWERGARGQLERGRALVAARVGPVRLLDNMPLGDEDR